MTHKNGVTTSFHNSGQVNLHVKTKSGETTIKNINSSEKEIVIKNKNGSVITKPSNDDNYKKVR